MYVHKHCTRTIESIKYDVLLQRKLYTETDLYLNIFITSNFAII